ncbi:diguanylate cyclase domain-containing protein [Kineococcus rubinsiae]|uniref:diguanylate cyclase domain-containing protein n=1 Tax=Kineococcus rubinsiae TaxID=2609562 RepID=UPI001431AE0D|nr:diguanylate cyclase [Kineococcus rubinsiae]NIZ90486.1 diguanylate cyclase [Kineococcus rubinsiae]
MTVPSGAERVRRRLALRATPTAAFALLYVVAVLVGRATRVEETGPAVVWPAGAVGFCWLAVVGSTRGRRLRAALAIALLGVVTLRVAGGAVPLAVALGLSGAVHALVGTGLVSALQRRRGRPGCRLREVADLGALLAGSAGGALAGGIVGAVVLHATVGVPVPAFVLSHGLRVGVSTFVLTAIVVRLADPVERRLVGTAREAWEAVGATLVVAGAYLVVFAGTVRLPIAYLLLPLSLCVALRLATTLAALHVVLVGGLVVLATVHGTGPFADEGPATILLAQSYIAVVALVTLVLALHRDERHRLVEDARAAHARADEQAAMLRTVIDTTSDGISVVDAAGGLVFSNPAAQAIFTRPPALLSPEETARYYRLSTPDGRPLAPPDRPLDHALRGEDVPATDVVVDSPGFDAPRILEMTARPLPAAAGAVMGFRDVTAQRASAAEVASSRDLFAGVLDASVDFAIVSTTLDGRITLFNSGAERMSGWSAQEMLGRSPSRLHDPAEIAARAAELGVPAGNGVLVAGIHDGGTETRRWTYRHRDGSTKQVSVTVSALRDGAGAVHGYMGVARDLTAELAAAAELAEFQEALHHQALHDPLTALPNRALFHDRLEHAIAGAARSAGGLGLLYLDLDGFKVVNDTSGHAAGDEVLRCVAQRLTACLRPGDTLARMGGDEFAVVCPDIDDDGLHAVADRVLGAVSDPFPLPIGTFRVGVSIGMAMATASTTAEQLLQSADEAMYAAKRAGKNRASRHRWPAAALLDV